MAASFVSGLQSSGAEVAFVLHSARLLIQMISAPTSRQELNWISKNLIEVLPAAVYVCNLEGVVVAFNRRATELWGTKPQAWFGSDKLYRSHGTYMPHTEAPVEVVLQTGDAALDLEAIIEQPDGLPVYQPTMLAIKKISPNIKKTAADFNWWATSENSRK